MRYAYEHRVTGLHAEQEHGVKAYILKDEGILDLRGEVLSQARVTALVQSGGQGVIGLVSSCRIVSSRFSLYTMNQLAMRQGNQLIF